MRERSATRVFEPTRATDAITVIRPVLEKRCDGRVGGVYFLARMLQTIVIATGTSVSERRSVALVVAEHVDVYGRLAGHLAFGAPSCFANNGTRFGIAADTADASRAVRQLRREWSSGASKAIARVAREPSPANSVLVHDVGFERPCL